MQRTDLYNIKKSRTFLSNDTYVFHGRESDSIPRLRYKVTSNYYNNFKIEYLIYTELYFTILEENLHLSYRLLHAQQI